MERYVTDIIRLTHAATRLGALPGTAPILANIPRLADYLEQAVAAQEAAFYAQPLMLASPQGGYMQSADASLARVPSVPSDIDAWLAGQMSPPGTPPGVRS